MSAERYFLLWISILKILLSYCLCCLLDPVGITYLAHSGVWEWVTASHHSKWKQYNFHIQEQAVSRHKIKSNVNNWDVLSQYSDCNITNQKVLAISTLSSCRVTEVYSVLFCFEKDWRKKLDHFSDFVSLLQNGKPKTWDIYTGSS